MIEHEYVLEFFTRDAKVRQLVTSDSAYANAQTALWQARGTNHTVQMHVRPRLVEQTTVEEIPANEYLCQS